VRREAGSAGQRISRKPRRRRRAGQIARSPQPCLCPVRLEGAPRTCWTRPHAKCGSRGGSPSPRLRCTRD
jgi:hypothetical protein